MVKKVSNPLTGRKIQVGGHHKNELIEPRKINHFFCIFEKKNFCKKK